MIVDLLGKSHRQWVGMALSHASTRYKTGPFRTGPVAAQGRTRLLPVRLRDKICLAPSRPGACTPGPSRPSVAYEVILRKGDVNLTTERGACLETAFDDFQAVLTSDHLFSTQLLARYVTMVLVIKLNVDCLIGRSIRP